jgi:hypothetical protein
MKIDSSNQRYVSAGLNDHADTGLNQQKWLREIERAHTEMIKNMRSVATSDASPNNPSQTLTEHSLSSEGTVHQQIFERFSVTLGEPLNEGLMKSPASISSAPVIAGESNAIAGTMQPLDTVKIALGLQEVLSEWMPEGAPSVEAANDLAESTQETWKSQNFHVQTTEDGVVVWMRNAGLGPDDEARILEQLRRGLSECGVRLHGFYLNGRPIVHVNNQS